MKKVYSVYQKVILWLVIAFSIAVVVVFLGVIGWVIESDFDLFPDRDGKEFLSDYAGIESRETDVYYKSFCFLECDWYFRFVTTDEEIQKVIKEQNLEKMPYSKEYFIHLLRFQPGEETTLYRQGNFLLYHDVKEKIAYIMIRDR